jgi:hypothetical protein
VVYKGSELLALKMVIADATNKEQASLKTVSHNDYIKPEKLNSKEEIPPENEFKTEAQLGKILNDFFEEVERSNYVDDGRAKKRRGMMRRGI